MREMFPYTTVKLFGARRTRIRTRSSRGIENALQDCASVVYIDFSALGMNLGWPTRITGAARIRELPALERA